MLLLHEREPDLGFADKIQRDLFLPQPNIGALALDKIVEVEIINPNNPNSKSIDTYRMDNAFDTVAALEDEYQIPFQPIRMMISSSVEGDESTSESIFVTTTADQGIDSRGFDLDRINLMSVLQYAALHALGEPIDQRPPRRLPGYPFVKAEDHGDIWTSTLLKHPYRTDAVYAGRTRDDDAIVTVLDKERAQAERTIVKSHDHIAYQHPYRVRPTVVIQ